ncbi:uncharacterized protein C8A04DRAFT_27643 [Dichotomopilus funicola]|uniref:HMG box domain-containing protein n=1 Tax=Dichotomopilus funicola TaxID=1934379 RepID=A0AAN6V4N1_9PEZI|nr:hypothetical protein C8A04DRAFT_27643 [Dichotomopilus funicola]
MLSAIGQATGRVGGRLAIRTVGRFTAQQALRATPVIPSGIRIAAVFTRNYAAAKTTKTSTTKAKKPAAKKTTAKKTTASKTTKKVTAKAKAAPKKRATKKKATKKKAAKKPARKLKKDMTEEEKVQLRIRKLREVALLKEEPTKLPTSAWTVYLTQRVRDSAKDHTVGGGEKFLLGGIAKQAASDFKGLSEAALEPLTAQAEENKVASSVAHRNWVDSYSPERIHKANLARKLLKKKHSVSSYPISDPRFPKRSLTLYVSYSKTRFFSPELANLSSRERIKTIAGEWKKLGPEERQRFQSIADTDKARYLKEMAAVKEQT